MSDYKWQHIHKRYFSKTRSVLCDVSLELSPGQCILLNGSNGSGKSTLLKVMSGLVNAELGTFSHNQISINLASRNRFLLDLTYFVHAQPYLFDGTTFYNLSIALQKMKVSASHSKLSNKLNKQYLIESVADKFAIKPYLNKHVDELSDGEKQRVALARCYLHRPKIILFDELNANLDEATKSLVLDILLYLKKQGIAIVIVEHNHKNLLSLADRVMCLRLGELTEK